VESLYLRTPVVVQRLQVQQLGIAMNLRVCLQMTRLATLGCQGHEAEDF